MVAVHHADGPTRLDSTNHGAPIARAAGPDDIRRLVAPWLRGERGRLPARDWDTERARTCTDR